MLCVSSQRGEVNRLLVVPKRTSRTPEDAWVGVPGLFHHRYEIDLVEISCVFTWAKERCEWLRHQWEPKAKRVLIGGPAYDDRGGEFEPGRYLKRGSVITSRGCIHNCPWCYVRGREGNIRGLEVKEGNIVQDNNLLACSRAHIEKVFAMLKTQRAIEFAGGLDGRCLKDWHIDALKGLRVKQMFFAYDDKDNRKWAIPTIEKMRKAGFPRDKVRCFVMVGRDETMDEAGERLRDTWEAGALPFAQVYDKLSGDKKAWARFARPWQRPAATKAMMKENK